MFKNEKIVETKICKHCNLSFEITDKDLEFYEKISPVFKTPTSLPLSGEEFKIILPPDKGDGGGYKYLIPPPTLCPDCRQQRRLSFVNEDFFYRSNCDLCNKAIITQYRPNSVEKVYCRNCYFSDKWNQLDYGKKVDFSKSMFDQFFELFKKIPHQNLEIDAQVENCEYIHQAGSCKNCYFIRHADFCENCYFGYGFKTNKYCVDGFYNMNSENCYECIEIINCNNLFYSQNCNNCSFCSFVSDSEGCNNCFLSVGLKNKQYCYKNKQYTKEEYYNKIKQIDLGDNKQVENLRNELEELKKHSVFKYYHGINIENCNGDYLNNCKNCDTCFNMENVENAKYSYQVVLGGKDIMDIYQYGTNIQKSYDSSLIGENSYNILFNYLVLAGCNNLIYSMCNVSCSNCFLCTGLINKSYCILNKEYSKEQYEKLVPKIIEYMIDLGEWGEFFPAKYSVFGYNETTASLYFPLKKEVALKDGFNWSDYVPAKPSVSKIIDKENIKNLPNIKNIPDDIINWALTCEISGKMYLITRQELEFYRKHKLPIPKRHPDQRHLDRMNLRNPRKLFDRKCDKCGKDIKTTYSPDRLEIVYCEECYNMEMY
ncbi:MAG: hypothetical protein PHE25_06260 [Candidatus Gracilibacteria bacterium]|nr:hypothetical protein [Candidatus Gracilibacteria bacterium]